MSNNHLCRILYWNIRHGGGSRAGKIVEQIIEWNPDIVALAEFRGTAPSKSIASKLSAAGYEFQLSTVHADEPTWNSLLLASRFEISKVSLKGTPQPSHRWLFAKVDTMPALHIGAVLVPLGKEWYDYLNALLEVVSDWQLGPGVIIGDTNCGLTGLDDETVYSANFKNSFVTPLAALGWRDMFRALHPDVDAPTWYSHTKNGFRLDHAYANTELQAHVRSCTCDWGRPWEQKKLSDHAAILLDVDLGEQSRFT